MHAVESGVEAGASEPVSAVEKGEEALLMGLRLREGIDLSRLERRTGRSLESIVETEILKRCIEEGYLTLSSDRLTATADGRMKLNAILGQLLD
jgi:coproporphyrinogen III oxidase-like Fe-S oxidoreductase